MEIVPGQTKIGWIGTGVMGNSMCGHLIRAGFSAVVFNRTPAKTAGLQDLGAIVARTPAEVAEQADVIFTIVGFPRDVREVTLGQQGTLQAAAPGKVLVDMTTSEPSLAVEIYNQAQAKGVHAIDAPVSGGDIGAREARLSIMLGGEREICDALAPCWQAMGKTIVYQGLAGSGQHTKMVNQVLIAGNMIGVCEALLYGLRSGLNLETVLQSVSSGAAGSWSLSNLAPRCIRGDFAPGFFVEHFIKDMGIAIAEAERMQLKLPGLVLARELYAALAEHGHSKSGTQALLLELAQRNNIEWEHYRLDGRN
jgi:3-hydroxyisobutyrate dehydrogenase